MIRIVDYGMGNLRSVQKALERVGCTAAMTCDPEEIRKAEKLILPGVGAFGAAMQNLERLGLVEPIKDFALSGRPFLGICLGMQLLLTQSDEMGSYQGFNLIPGRVVKFPKSSLKVPHIGWNSLKKATDCPLFSGIADGTSVYFVHSFYVDPPMDAVATTTDYGVEFCSAIHKGNIFATQFHPEKSGAVGLRMLENFAAMKSGV